MGKDKRNERFQAMAKMFGKSEDDFKRKSTMKDDSRRATAMAEEENETLADELSETPEQQAKEDREGTEMHKGVKELIAPQLNASLATESAEDQSGEDLDYDFEEGEEEPLKHRLFGGKNINIIIAMNKKKNG